MKPLAKSFTTCSESYEISRPGYPAVIADLLKNSMNIKTTAKMLELAAGTGKCTSMLAQQGFNPTVTDLTANMLQVIKSKYPKLPMAIANAQEIPFKNDSFDCVLTAQAFHWFANATAVSEIARVLKKDGYLVIVFQERNTKVEWVAEDDRIVFSYPHESFLYFYENSWMEAFENQHHFGPIEHQQFDYSFHFAKKDLVHRALAMSFISALPDDQKQQVTREMQDFYSSHEALKDRNFIDFPYITHVYWAKVLK